jgi:hypothetical protein
MTLSRLRNVVVGTVLAVALCVVGALAPLTAEAHYYYGGYVCFSTQGLYYQYHYHPNPPTGIHGWHDTHYHWVGYC